MEIVEGGPFAYPVPEEGDVCSRVPYQSGYGQRAAGAGAADAPAVAAAVAAAAAADAFGHGAPASRTRGIFAGPLLSLGSRLPIRPSRPSMGPG